MKGTLQEGSANPRADGVTSMSREGVEQNPEDWTVSSIPEGPRAEGPMKGPGGRGRSSSRVPTT